MGTQHLSPCIQLHQPACRMRRAACLGAARRITPDRIHALHQGVHVAVGCPDSTVEVVQEAVAVGAVHGGREEAVKDGQVLDVQRDGGWVAGLLRVADGQAPEVGVGLERCWGFGMRCQRCTQPVNNNSCQ